MVPPRGDGVNLGAHLFRILMGPNFQETSGREEHRRI